MELTSALFCLVPLTGVVFMVLVQHFGENPVRLLWHPHAPTPPSSNTIRPIHWQSVVEIILVITMLLPILVILYGLVIAFSGVVWLVDAGMVLMCLLLLAVALEMMETCTRYRASEQWPTTWGRFYSGIRGETYPGIQPPSAIPMYVYAVNGRQFVGNKIDAHDVYTRPLVRRPYRRVRNAEQVLVYYHPHDPETALLVPGINWSMVAVILGCALTFVMVPLFFNLL